MGANIKIEGRRAIVRGKSELSGAAVLASDLRASASLVLGRAGCRRRNHHRPRLSPRPRLRKHRRETQSRRRPDPPRRRHPAEAVIPGGVDTPVGERHARDRGPKSHSSPEDMPFRARLTKLATYSTIRRPIIVPKHPAHVTLVQTNGGIALPRLRDVDNMQKDFSGGLSGETHNPYLRNGDRAGDVRPSRLRDH